MASSAPGKKFKNSNLNAVVGAPKQNPTNVGPAVRSAAVIKPKAKPKGLVALGKAPTVGNATARRGAAWSQLESKAKEKGPDDLNKSPDWAVLDFRDLDKPLIKDEIDTGANDDDETGVNRQESAQSEDADEKGEPCQSKSWLDQGDAVECQRQFSNSHRSYLSMDYSPEAMNKTVGSDFGHRREDDSRSGSHLASPGKSSPLAGRSPVMQPDRTDRSASWADQFEQSDEDDLGPGQLSGGDSFFAQSGAGNDIGHGGKGGLTGMPMSATVPPPSRRPPPQAPPAAPQQNAMSPMPHLAPDRFAAPLRPPGPPPPTPPPAGPGAYSKAHMGDSRDFSGSGHINEDERQRGRQSKVDDSWAPGHGDARLPEAYNPQLGYEPYSGPREDDVVHASERRRGWGNPDEPPRGWGPPGRGPPPQRSPPPAEMPPRQHHSPAAQAEWEPPRALKGGGGQQSRESTFGTAVAYTPSFARGPVNRPMSEDFANSGWKEKKLWQPPTADERAVGKGRAKAGASKNGAEGKGAPPGLKDEELIPPSKTMKSEADSEQKPRKSKVKPPPKGPLEALDPDSSSEEDSDDDDTLPPEYAVLDLTVPRTALVINVSHVLKRLSGCCSLNQLNKALKNFKEKTGVTLETFLRANPMNFKLDGRIVYLIDRDGSKWQAPEVPAGGGAAETPAKGGKSRGKGKQSRGGSNGQQTGKSEHDGGKGGKGKKSKNEQKANYTADDYDYDYDYNWEGSAPATTGKKSKKKAKASEWSAQAWESEWWTSDSRGGQWSW